MNRKQVERWERQRAPGRLHYIFFTGVLQFGIGATVLGVLFDLLWESGTLESLSAGRGGLGMFIAMRLLYALLGGSLWGLCMWYMMERAYRQARENEGHED